MKPGDDDRPRVEARGFFVILRLAAFRASQTAGFCPRCYTHSLSLRIAKLSNHYAESVSEHSLGLRFGYNCQTILSNRLAVGGLRIVDLRATTKACAGGDFLKPHVFSLGRFRRRRAVADQKDSIDVNGRDFAGPFGRRDPGERAAAQLVHAQIEDVVIAG